MSVMHEKVEHPQMSMASTYITPIHLKTNELGDMAPLLVSRNDEISDDSSLMKLPDSDDSNSEDNSPHDKDSLATLKFDILNEDNSLIESVIVPDQDVKITFNEDMLDEYPLFNNHNLLNNTVLEDEFRLSSPEKPINQEHNSLRQTKAKKSRIPLPTSTTGIRKSKRLLEASVLEPESNHCSPKKLEVVLKPSIKANLCTLNFIVNASTGELHDATKYATEINSTNSEGILIPNNPDELITIPVAGSRAAVKTNKLAYVRAYEYSHSNQMDSEFAELGFYTEEQHKKYFSTGESPAKIAKVTKKKATPRLQKKLRWASDLEW